MTKENENVFEDEYEYEHEHILADGTTVTHSHAHTHTQTKAVLNRMARIIGHMKSVKQMVEDGRDCSEVLIQLSAVDAAVRSVSRVILRDHVANCIVDAVKSGDEGTVEKLNQTLALIFK